MNIEQMNRVYESWMSWPLLVDYYEHSDFFNVGYWLPATSSQVAACENMVDRLVSLLPDTRGNILDVACGKGATTRHLLRYYPPARIVGLNIAPAQLRASKTNAPGCALVLMDAAELGFADCSFDAIICIEAIFHFRTRVAFLQEVLRILKPGGYLLYTDMLYHSYAGVEGFLVPEHNRIAGLEEYADLYRLLNFDQVTINDITALSWMKYCENLERWATRKHLDQELSAHDIDMLRNNVLSLAVANYLLVAARKPSG